MFLYGLTATAGSLIEQGYSPEKIGFHSAGHLQRWANSPLRDQDPHLWTAFFVLFLLGGFTLAWKFYRGRREFAADAGRGSKLDILAAELEGKKNRLAAKIDELDRKFAIRKINSDEYNKLCDRYKSELDRTDRKLKQIKELGERQQ